jgi:hypothetical protein
MDFDAVLSCRWYQIFERITFRYVGNNLQNYMESQAKKTTVNILTAVGTRIYEHLHIS